MITAGLAVGKRIMIILLVLLAGILLYAYMTLNWVKVNNSISCKVSREMWKKLIQNQVSEEDFNNYTFGSPASQGNIRAVEETLGQGLPNSLVDILHECNGIKASWGNLVWSTSEIVARNIRERESGSPIRTGERPEDYIFFMDGCGEDLFAFRLKGPEEDREKVFVYERAFGQIGFAFINLEEFIAAWIRSHRLEFYRGPEHLQQYAHEIPRILSHKLPHKLTVQEQEYIWQKLLRCSCGAEDQFQLSYCGEKSTDGGICDTEEFNQKEELICNECKRTILLFDPTSHGYNAVVCEFRVAKQEEARQRKTDQIYSCSCSSHIFSIIAQASYDSSYYEMIDLENQKQLDESYGWFNIYVICSNCGKVSVVIDYECA